MPIESEALLNKLRELGIKTAVGSSSNNTSAILHAARRLGVEPSQAILFEDALAGVEAGKRDGFRCVVGIDHGQQSTAVSRHGRYRHQELARRVRGKLTSPRMVVFMIFTSCC